MKITNTENNLTIIYVYYIALFKFFYTKNIKSDPNVQINQRIDKKFVYFSFSKSELLKMS